jgi:serine/threonine-protein kinase
VAGLEREPTEDAGDSPSTVVDTPRTRRGPGPARPGASDLHDTPLTQKLPTQRGSWAGSLPTASGTVATPGDAMRADEIERAHVFYRVIVAVVISMLLVLPLLDGDPTGKWMFAVGLLLYGVAISLFEWRIRDPSEYRDRNLMPVGVIGVAAAYAGIYYWGLFSPAAVMLAMVLYFNSLVGSFRYAFFVYFSCALAQTALSVLVIGGWVADVGLIRAGSASTLTQIVGQAMVQGVLLATFLIARLSRRATLDSIAQLEQAVRGMAAREALLAEARQEFERVAWVGGPGRFTDQHLGSFKLGVILGRGAMGEIYEASHLQTGAPAAVKLLHRNVLQDPDYLQRFAREARAAAALDVPNVVRVLEVSDGKAEIPYLAMERLAGVDLAAYLRKRRRLPPIEVVDLVVQVGRGVDAARKAGIVHRDLKPQNIFRARQSAGPPIWKILDFGVSKLADHGGTLTQGQAIGTPAYMSPEQARGEEVDHRSDVYALAAIAYRALTGRAPFGGKDVPALIHNVVYKMPPRPSDFCTLEFDVEAVLAIGLAKRREQRFQTALELADALVAAEARRLDDAVRLQAEALFGEFPWAKGL